MSNKTVKILAVSDKVVESHHSPHVHMLYPRLDLILGCGDLPYYYLDFLVSALDAPMLYVLGNHDAGRQYSAEHGELSEVRGGRNVHRRCVREQGLLIAGLEGSIRYRPGRKLQYTDSEMRTMVLRLLTRLLVNRIQYGRYLDILITHSPPLGIHDEDDPAHRGFRIFPWFLRVAKPRYMLHGHIHRYIAHRHQITRYHATTVINVYPNYYFEVDVR